MNHKLLIGILIISLLVISGCDSINLDKPVCFEVLKAPEGCGITTFQINENTTRAYLINCNLTGLKVAMEGCN